MILVYKPFSSINYAFKGIPSPRDRPRKNLSSISSGLTGVFLKLDAWQPATPLSGPESLEAH